MATHDVPLTPFGQIFVQPESDHIIHCLIGGEKPIDIDAVKSVIRNSVMVKHYKFSSLLVIDSYGREHWKKTTIELDRHIIVVNDPVGPSGDDEEALNNYAADLAVSSPLSVDKPLWEVHLLMAHNCALFRLHHAIGDGTSLMSMLSTCGRAAGDSDHPRQIKSTPSSNTRGVTSVWGFLKMIWFTLIYTLESQLRICGVKDKNPISGGAGVEMWPRKLATAKFFLNDMVIVKNIVPRATINDVLCGVISSGLSRYLDVLSANPIQKGLKITGQTMVYLRPPTGLAEKTSKSPVKDNVTPMTWSNGFGLTLLHLYYQKAGSDPLSYVKRANKVNERKKQSIEPVLSRNFLGSLMSMSSNIGRKLAFFISYRMMCNTSFTLSNMVGPKEEVTIAGNPVKFLRITTTSLPHAIAMHFVSYAGKADLQILVAKDIIPEPQLLAKFMEEALLDMKQAAICLQSA